MSARTISSLGLDEFREMYQAAKKSYNAFAYISQLTDEEKQFLMMLCSTIAPQCLSSPIKQPEWFRHRMPK